MRNQGTIAYSSRAREEKKKRRRVYAYESTYIEISLRLESLKAKTILSSIYQGFLFDFSVNPIVKDRAQLLEDLEKTYLRC